MPRRCARTGRPSLKIRANACGHRHASTGSAAVQSCASRPGRGTRDLGARPQADLCRPYYGAQHRHTRARHLPDLPRRPWKTYAAIYDPEAPAEAYWNAANIVALLVLAREDGQPVRNPVGLEPEDIARRTAAAIEPLLAATNDPWMLASSGEVLLALKDYETAAQRFGAFARHRNTHAFMLASALRQLKFVWRIAPGHASAGPFWRFSRRLKSARTKQSSTCRVTTWEHSAGSPLHKNTTTPKRWWKAGTS